MTDFSMERALDLGYATGTLRCALIHLECGNVDWATRDIREALEKLDATNAKRNAAIFAM